MQTDVPTAQTILTALLIKASKQGRLTLPCENAKLASALRFKLYALKRKLKALDSAMIQPMPDALASVIDDITINVDGAEILIIRGAYTDTVKAVTQFLTAEEIAQVSGQPLSKQPRTSPANKNQSNSNSHSHLQTAASAILPKDLIDSPEDLPSISGDSKLIDLHTPYYDRSED